MKSVVPQQTAARRPKIAGSNISVISYLELSDFFEKNELYALSCFFKKASNFMGPKTKCLTVSKIKFGFQFPNVMGYSSFDRLRKIAETAEELSYDSIWTSDHVLPVKAFQKSERPGLYESVTTLAYLAAATNKITIGSSILLPLRHPLLLATMLNTIDHASSGRLEVGYGVGWYRSEFENMGIPFSKRGKVATEQLKILIELWTKSSVNYSGEFYKLENAEVVPSPVQKPHPPILIGGTAKQSYERVVEIGNGWMPFASSVNEVKKGMEEIRQIASSKKKKLKDDFLLYVDLPTTLKSKAPIDLPKTDENKEESLTGDSSVISKRIENYMNQGVKQIIVEFEKPGKEIEDLKDFKGHVMSRF
jgi:probable F420-dependent oxidoreductase